MKEISNPCRWLFALFLMIGTYSWGQVTVIEELFSDHGRWMHVDTTLDASAIVQHSPVLVYSWNRHEPSLPERANALHLAQETFPEIKVIARHVQRNGIKENHREIQSSARYARFRYTVFADSIMSDSIPQDRFWFFARGGELIAEGNGRELGRLDSLITQEQLMTKGKAIMGFDRYTATADMADFSHLKAPVSISGDKAYSELHVSESLGRRIIITDLDGRVKDVIGTGKPGAVDGPFESCSFSRPEDLVYDQERRRLFINDRGHGSIRIAELDARKLSTLTLKDKDENPFEFPSSVGSLDWKGTLLIACSMDAGACYVIEPNTGLVEEFLIIGGTKTRVDKKRKRTELEELGPVLTMGDWTYVTEESTNTLLRMDEYRVEVIHSNDPSIQEDFNCPKEGPSSIGSLAWLRNQLVVIDPLSRSIWSYEEESSLPDQWEWDDLGSPLSKVTDIVQLGNQFFLIDAGRNEIRVLEDGILRPLRISNLDRLLTSIPPRVHVMLESIAPSALDQTTIMLDLELPEGMVLDPGHRSAVMASASSQAYIKEPSLSGESTEIIILPEENKRQLNLMYDLYLLENTQITRWFFLPLQVTIPLDSTAEESTYHEIGFKVKGRVSDDQRSLFNPSIEGE